MTKRLVLDFEHNDVNTPRPWPVGLEDGIVTSGLGPDDGAMLIGFAKQGTQSIEHLVDEIESLDWAAERLVPVFSKDGGFFNWDLVVRGLREIETSTDPAVVGPGATHTVDLPKAEEPSPEDVRIAREAAGIAPTEIVSPFNGAYEAAIKAIELVRQQEPRLVLVFTDATPVRIGVTTALDMRDKLNELVEVGIDLNTVTIEVTR